MKVLLLALVVIGALFVIAGGLWVAVALARVVGGSRSLSEPEPSATADD